MPADWSTPILQNREAVMWYVFIGVFLFVGIVETYFPQTANSQPQARRWLLHGFLYGLSSVLTQLLFRTGGVALAQLMNGTAWGSAQHQAIPFPIHFAIGILAMDAARYLVHWLMHRVPALWRVHAVHHSDCDFDLTTGLRFHPLEALLVVVFTYAAIITFAVPISAVFVYELLAMQQGLLSHANASLPPRLEPLVSRFWVTPNFHRLHHMREQRFQRANLGVLFPWWDHIFRTFQRLTPADDRRMGLDEVDAATSLSLSHVLGMPFRAKLKTDTSARTESAAVHPRG